MLDIGRTLVLHLYWTWAEIERGKKFKPEIFMILILDFII
jgi:hypothetical protein